MTRYMRKDDFIELEIKPFLGDYADDYDLDGIFDEVAEWDERLGYVWKSEFVDQDDGSTHYETAYNKVLMRHDMTDPDNGYILLWQDLKDAIDAAHDALYRLGTFGMVAECDELSNVIMPALGELGVWHYGMEELAERRVQDINRDAVVDAYMERIKPVLEGGLLNLDDLFGDTK